MKTKVRILQDGKYSDFEIPGYRHRVGVKRRVAGDVIDYPDWYAEESIKGGVAEAYVEAQHAKLIDATDAAFRLASELDVDLLALKGSGKGGRITAGDVRKAAQ